MAVAGTGMAIASIVGATAAVGGAVYAGHQGAMAKKEVNRQKSIAAEQMRLQGIEVAAAKEKAAVEDKAAQDEIMKIQRSEAQSAQDLLDQQNAVAGTIRTRKQRGRRSLIYGSETGINDPFKDTLG